MISDDKDNTTLPESAASLVRRVEEAENARDINFSTCADLERDNKLLRSQLTEARKAMRTPGTVEVCSLCKWEPEWWPNAGLSNGKCHSYEHIEEGRPCPLRPTPPDASAQP